MEQAAGGSLWVGLVERIELNAPPAYLSNAIPPARTVPVDYRIPCQIPQFRPDILEHVLHVVRHALAALVDQFRHVQDADQAGEWTFAHMKVDAGTDGVYEWIEIAAVEIWLAVEEGNGRLVPRS